MRFVGYAPRCGRFCLLFLNGWELFARMARVSFELHVMNSIWVARIRAYGV